MVVCVKVGIGVGLNVGSGVSVGACVGVKAITVSVPEIFADSAVNAMTVGRYSGGKGVGMVLEVGGAKGEQAIKSPRREAKRKRLRIKSSLSHLHSRQVHTCPGCKCRGVLRAALFAAKQSPTQMGLSQILGLLHQAKAFLAMTGDY